MELHTDVLERYAVVMERLMAVLPQCFPNENVAFEKIAYAARFDDLRMGAEARNLWARIDGGSCMSRRCR